MLPMKCHLVALRVKEKLRLHRRLSHKASKVICRYRFSHSHASQDVVSVANIEPPHAGSNNARVAAVRQGGEIGQTTAGYGNDNCLVRIGVLLQLHHGDFVLTGPEFDLNRPRAFALDCAYRFYPGKPSQTDIDEGR